MKQKSAFGWTPPPPQHADVIYDSSYGRALYRKSKIYDIVMFSKNGSINKSTENR